MVLFFDSEVQTKTVADIVIEIGSLWNSKITDSKGFALTVSNRLIQDAIMENNDKECKNQQSEILDSSIEKAQLGVVSRDSFTDMLALKNLITYMSVLDEFCYFRPKECKKTPRMQGYGNGPWYHKPSMPV